MTYCCKMRERYLVGIVAVDQRVPNPPDVADYIDWDHKTMDGRAIIRIKYCPFCGQAIQGPLRMLEVGDGHE